MLVPSPGFELRFFYAGQRTSQEFVRATERCTSMEGCYGSGYGDIGGGAVSLPGWFEVGLVVGLLACWLGFLLVRLVFGLVEQSVVQFIITLE